MAVQQVGRHPQQLLFHGVGVGNHASEEHIGCPWHGRQGGAEAAAGAGLRDRQGVAPLTQALDHHRRQRIAIGAVAMGAGALAQLGLHRLQQGRRRRWRGGPGGDAQLHLAGAGIGGHGGVLQGQQIGHRFGQARFGHPPEAQQAAGKHALGQARLAQPGHGRGRPHGPQLAGHARKGDHGEAWADREPRLGRLGAPDHAGGRAGWIGQHQSPSGQQGLLAITG